MDCFTKWVGEDELKSRQPTVGSPHHHKDSSLQKMTMHKETTFEL